VSSFIIHTNLQIIIQKRLSDLDNFIATGLPEPVFLLAVVDEGTVPTVGTADGGDDLLVFGGDEALAVAHLEILGEAEGVDRLVRAFLFLCVLKKYDF
jgi:hypothetical protein